MIQATSYCLSSIAACLAFNIDVVPNTIWAFAIFSEQLLHNALGQGLMRSVSVKFVVACVTKLSNSFKVELRALPQL